MVGTVVLTVLCMCLREAMSSYAKKEESSETKRLLDQLNITSTSSESDGLD